ncbi:MAG: hypothetical protein V7642_5511 [Burkholderiales bacterium]
MPASAVVAGLGESPGKVRTGGGDITLSGSSGLAVAGEVSSDTGNIRLVAEEACR